MAFILVLTTCPSIEVAEKLAAKLVRERLVACVNIVPGVKSLYMWKSKMELENEVILVMKTVEENYDRIEDEILLEHPYQLPEIIALPISKGFDKYLEWLEENSRKD